ncbi:MAG: cyclomaltodextrinase N-terminal domain-containing protein [Gemmatimonadetes bacterium]|nr:cyclomaltodextrinase N-terminal domain-containing protein [Gemmatimonadota bacterium]
MQGKLWGVVVAGATLLLAGVVPAQGPTVSKVEPPNWWANSSVNPVRVLVRGTNLAGARFECGRLTCGNVKVNERGTYAFVDVVIPRDATAGSYPLTVRTGGGSVAAPFSIAPRLAGHGRFQGFGTEDVMYLLMPDRFANGDPSNDDPAVSRGLLDRSKGRYYHGGDLAGVRQKLPYLKSVGVTTIWMNPIYDNNNGLNRKETYDNQPITDYHGYGATDFYAVDEHMGDVAAFKQLVDDAHAQGIKVVLDMVANHTGPYHPWVQDAPTPTWFHGTEANHPNNTWQTWTLADRYSTPAMRQTTLDGWFINILPDLNQDDPEVARYIIQNTLWWVGVSGMDGIRQDTWPYVPRWYWRDWMTAIKNEYPSLRVVGEVFDGDPSMIAFFEGGRQQWDGVDDKVDLLFDFPMYYAIRGAFARGEPVRQVAQMLSRDHIHRDPQNLVTFLGLHDVSRFMHEPGATPDGLKLAFTFLFTARGTPLVYYGDEIAIPGGNDPDNRRDFPGGWSSDPRNAFDAAGRNAAEQDVWRHVQKVAQIRAARQELRGGATEHLFVSDQVYVYRRGGTIVAINNGKEASDVTIPATALPADALGVCAAGRPVNGATVVRVPARASCIF